MSMLVNCSNCNTTLQLWPGAQSTRCGICHAITHIAEPRSLQQRPPPPSSTHHHPYGDSPSMAPSPYNHAPPGPSPSVYGRKRAVICGISYKNSSHEVKGAINDPKFMKYLLVNCFNFPESSILMLTGVEGRYVCKDHRPRSGMWKGSNGGEVISFSGCDDDQQSEDTSVLSRIGPLGAMTYSFIQAIQRGHGATYGAMLNAMWFTILNMDDDNLGGGGGLRQEPQLTANERFDVYAKPFSL